MTLNEWINERLTWRPVLGGQWVFKGTELQVGEVIGLIRSEATYSTMFAEYPFLTTEDIRNAVLFHKDLNL